MNVDMRQFFQIFFAETEELLAEKEQLLLNLDLSDPDAEDIDAIFRAAHSIKGGAATFGLSDMTEVTHVMESLLDQVRVGNMRLTGEHVEIFLQAKDVIKMLCDGHQHGAEVNRNAVAEVMARLEALSHTSGSVGGADRPQKGKSAPVVPTICYEIELPAMDARQLDILLGELKMLGELEQEITPDGNALLRLISRETRDDILSVCSFLLNPDDLAITEDVMFSPEGEEEGEEDEEDPGYGFFDNIVLPSQHKNDDETIKADENAGGKKAARSSFQSVASSSIRVGMDKVDQLINLVGELVITQAMIEQQSTSLDPMVYQHLLDSVNQLSRNSRDLQQAVMSMRMMPMDYVFSRFPRMVHDLASKLGKKVELVISGAATELDKSLIERIIDPLTHLVRNSVDHGIEMPDVRHANGKIEVGRLFLSASHQGGNILIEVNDDGAGLDREKIMERARKRGLPVFDNMSDSEVWNLIFSPGFSTVDVVTDVSGRGVGMDVVKRNITEMGGVVDIRSARGMGTMLSVYLPLSLAILEGMSVRTGDEIYILPLGHVVESLQPLEGDIREISGQDKVIRVRGDYLALISLADVFSIVPRATTPSEGIVVILEADGNRLALLVDELVGQQQVVVKSLETNYRKVPNVSGATIMGDGEVALIVDVSGILRTSNLNNDMAGFAL